MTEFFRMIPYFNITTFHLGPLMIHTWGFLVSIGFAVGIFVAYRRAKVQGLDPNKLLDLAFWIIVSAMVGARLFHVFFYEWHYYHLHMGEILRIDQGGLSSFGGIIGAAVGAVFYVRRKSMPFIPYAEALMFGWPVGHAIGRVGCYLTHMHPGRLSSAFWAVSYPGGARLDMGIIEAFFLALYFIVVLIVLQRHYRPGLFLVSGMVYYGVLRFVLDFFRANDMPMADTRYLGLTPAQYGGIALIVLGAFIWYRRGRTQFI